jgi:hypothetical protein
MSRRAQLPEKPATETIDEADPWRPAGSVVVAALALAWLAIDLGIAYKTINEGVLASTQVALFLPSITAAALVGGGAVGVLAVGRLANRFGGVERVLPRIASGAAGGAAVAVVAVAGMLAAYHSGASVVAVSVTVAVTAIAGGALAACRPVAAVAAGLAGTLAYAAVSFIEAIFRNQLLNLFGDTNTVGTYITADNRLSLVVSILTGIVGGTAAFLFLRRSGLTLPWPAYLAAGAIPGAALLLAELAAWLGGAPLMRAVGRLSEFDRLALSTLQPGRINHDMIVFFAGTITAVILVGRTMRART